MTAGLQFDDGPTASVHRDDGLRAFATRGWRVVRLPADRTDSLAWCQGHTDNFGRRGSTMGDFHVHGETADESRRPV